MINMKVMKDASEIITYNNPDIPLHIKKEKLSMYPTMSALCHWHEDIEYIRPLKGHITYNINGKRIVIKENDAILVNSRQLHYGYSADKSDCEFLCIVFRPELICSNPALKSKYIYPIIDNEHITEYYLNHQNPSAAVLIGLFDAVYEENLKKDARFELNILNKLNIIWSKWLELLQPYLTAHEYHIDENLSIQKNMAAFIYSNYQSKITLNDIAASGNVCRSKCCQLFKKYQGQSPVDFLNMYRLEVSLDHLRNKNLSITDVAYLCGFHSPSYYTQTFTRYKGYSPGQYRRHQNYE